MFDISTNLTSACFAKDYNAVVKRAFSSGVKGLLITANSLLDSLHAQKLAKCHAHCWSTAGVHPHNSSKWEEETYEDLFTVAKSESVIAIGECGLDFYRNLSSPKKQKEVFILQLSLAAEIGIPVFLHCRDAYDRFFNLVDPWLNRLPGAVLHCFTGSKQDMKSCLKRGIYIGITGLVCDERRGMELRALLPFIPSERLLLETDSPYLIPRDLVPKPISNRNEPYYLKHILQKVAFFRKELPEELEEQTNKNVRYLFDITF